MKVIQIAGVGRSGSTLLAQLLAKSPEVVSIGESRAVWRSGFTHNLQCSCRAPFDECPFWTETVRRALGDPGREIGEEVWQLEHRVVRYRRWPALAARPPTPELERLLGLVGAVYRGALDTAGAAAVVDSTKNPVYGMAMSRMADVDYHVVHLVRDPRGAVHSWQRTIDSSRLGTNVATMGTVAPQRAAREWTRNNLLAEALRARAASYTFVRYEDLVADPSQVLGRITAAAGLAPLAEPLDPSAISLPPTHFIGGNVRRRFGDPVIALRNDDEWRTAMAPAARRATLQWCWALMAAYRYLP